MQGFTCNLGVVGWRRESNPHFDGLTHLASLLLIPLPDWWNEND